MRKFEACVFVLLLLCLPWLLNLAVYFALRQPPKPIGHYAVDESPSYVVWYAVEAFPGALKSTLKPK